MAQIKTFKWTTTTPEEPLALNVGFIVSDITVARVTSVGCWRWILGMDNDSYINISDGTIVATNGFTPIRQKVRYGAVISGFTNAVNGVLTVDDTRVFGFAIGDTIKVAQLADDLTGESTLNSLYTILSLTPVSITVEEDTSTPGFSVYVSGGTVTRVSDIDDEPIPTENFAITGIILGTDVVGTAGEDAVAVVSGENSVV
jgi:hypothetical protein